MALGRTCFIIVPCATTHCHVLSKPTAHPCFVVGATTHCHVLSKPTAHPCFVVGATTHCHVLSKPTAHPCFVVGATTHCQVLSTLPGRTCFVSGATWREWSRLDIITPPERLYTSLGVYKCMDSLVSMMSASGES